MRAAHTRAQPPHSGPSPIDDSPGSRALDAVRGLAAVLVVAGHCRQLIADAGAVDPSRSGVLDKALLVPTSFAQESVAVFFVLSGYLVGGQVVRQCRDDRFGWGEYVAKRLSRLWTVLLPGLLITWLVVAAAGPLIPSALRSRWGGGHDSLLAAACNGAFLQESRCPPFGVNESLWSLSYEFWFYVVFAAACAAFAAARRHHPRTAMFNVAVLAGAVAIFGPHLFLLIPAWLLGVVVALVPRTWMGRRLRGPAWLGAAVIVLALTMLASSLIGLGRIELTAMVGIPALLVVLAASRIDAVPPWLGTALRPASTLGRVSFSTYVFHVPFVAVGAAAIVRLGLLQRVGLPVLSYALVALVLPVTWALWWLTERHTPVVRQLALRLATPRRVLPPDPDPAPLPEIVAVTMAEDEPGDAWAQIARSWASAVR